MKKLRYFAISILVAFVTFSCSSHKKINLQAQIKTLDSLVVNKHFTIESTRAHPQISNAMQQVLNSDLMRNIGAAGNVNLIGNYNYLTISDDSISSYLPYFGERQMNVSYGGGDAAIAIKGVVEKYSVEKNKDNSYHIHFTAKNNTNRETFDISIKLFPNLKSTIFINSSFRSSISYSGEVIMEEKKSD